MPRTASIKHGHGRLADRRLAALAATATAVVLGISALAVVPAALTRGGSAAAPPPGAGASTPQTTGTVPISFEPNVGQTAPQVRFLTHADGGTVFLTSTGAVWSIAARTPQRIGVHPASGPPSPGLALRMQLVGSDVAATTSPADPLAGRVNYLMGANPSAWHRNIPTYGQVVSHDVYPGVDLVWHGTAGHLEYDLVVAPDADASMIALSFEGAQSMAVDQRTGDLVLQTVVGQVVERAPDAFQMVNGMRAPVDAGFVMTGPQTVGFWVDSYDHTLPLVIDPVISYGTYLGGSSVSGDFYGQGGNSYACIFYCIDNNTSVGGTGAVAVDKAQNAYVVGQTNSPDFPTSSGAYQTTPGSLTVTKLNPAGGAVVYSTYIGSQPSQFGGETEPIAIAVDANGAAAVAGFTTDSSYPTTPGVANQPSPYPPYAGFVTKLDATGSSLAFSASVGVSVVTGAGFDAADELVISGVDEGPSNFGTASIVTTPGAFQTAAVSGQPLFVQKFNPAGSAFVYSTYIDGSDGECYGTNYGGPTCPLAVDAAGDAYVAGTSGASFPVTPGAVNTGGGTFVTKLNPSGSALIYSASLGVASDYYAVSGGAIGGIAVDTSGRAVVAGIGKLSTTTPGAYDSAVGALFVAELNAGASGLLYATQFGGTPPNGSSGAVRAAGVALTPGGDIWALGLSTSEQAPEKDPVQELCGCYYSYVNPDAYVVKLRPAGHGAADLLFASNVGGAGGDYPGIANSLALDGHGNAYITGQSDSGGFFPTTPGAVQPLFHGSNDLFVAKISNVCDTPITGSITGDVVVPAGGVACLFKAKVSGSVTVQRGGDLSIDNSTIGGAVTASSATSVTICATTVNAGVQVSGTTGFVRLGGPRCLGNKFTRDVVIKNNKQGLELGHAVVTGNVTITDNSGIPVAEDLDLNSNPYSAVFNPEVEGNKISGNLTCSGNSLEPINDGFKNKVLGATVGQCAGL